MVHGITTRKATAAAATLLGSATIGIGSALGDPIAPLSIGYGWPDVAMAWVMGWVNAHWVVQAIWGVTSLLVIGEITGISGRIRDRIAGRIAGSAAQIDALGNRIEDRFDRLEDRFNAIEGRVAQIEGRCKAVHGLS